jgi:hypothetical protein
MREERYRTYVKLAWSTLMFTWLYLFAAVMWRVSAVPRKNFGQFLRLTLLIQGFWFPILVVVLWLQSRMTTLPESRLQWSYDIGVIILQLILACGSAYQMYKAFNHTHNFSFGRFTKGFLIGAVLASVPIALALQLIRAISAQPLSFMQ